MLLLRVHVLLLSLMVASEACEPNDPDGHRPSSGALLYNQHSDELLQNNSMVSAQQVTTTKGIVCISDATDIDVATWIHPSNTTLPTYPDSSAFIFITRSCCNGFVELKHAGRIPEEDQGVYTCIIRDRNDTLQTLYIGFYSSLEGLQPPEVTGLYFEYTARTASFKLDCVTTKRPPTVVSWSKDGSNITSSGLVYETTQWLANATSATYHNLLYVSGPQTGEYNCMSANMNGTTPHGSRSIWIIGSPSNLVAEIVARDEVLLRWTLPQHGQHATGYQIYTCHRLWLRNNSMGCNFTNCNCSVVENTAQSFSIAELDPDREYTFLVDSLAQGENTTVLPSETLVHLTLTAPLLPNVIVSGIQTMTVLVVSKPEENGIVVDGYTLTYEGECEEDELVTVHLNGSELYYELGDLRSGTNYSVMLRAGNRLGWSLWNTISFATPVIAPPGPPQAVHVSFKTSTYFVLTWNEVKCFERYGRILGYCVEVYNESSESIIWNNTAEPEVREVQITDLMPGATYVVKVAARNERGTGVFSMPLKVETDQPASATNGSDDRLTYILAGVVGGTLVAVMLAIAVILTAMFCRKRKGGLADHPMSLTTLIGTTEPDCVTEVCISEFPEDSAATIGEYVVFQVRVYGNPTPTLIWLHNGESIGSDCSIEIGDDGTLAIPSAEFHHAGTYRLVASNGYSSTYKELTLSIEDEEEEEEEELCNVVGTGDEPSVSNNKSVPLHSFEQFVARHHVNNNQPFHFQFMCLSGASDKIVSVGTSPENESLNRKKRIVPFDDNRIRLSPFPGYETCQLDYINASYVDGHGQPRKFIATQGPLPHTVTDFWRLVWQERCSLVVMLCNVKESNRVRCQQYWPSDRPVCFGPFSVALSAAVQKKTDYVIRTMEVTLLTKTTDSTLTVTMFHYTSWPDRGVPDYAGPLLALRKVVMSKHKHTKGPILVHCSAGVGRTGVFIALDIALERVEVEEAVDINGTITRMRQQRMKLVQTVAQYILVHDSILEFVVCGETKIPSHDLRITRIRLSRVDGTGVTGFEKQFQVLQHISPQPLKEERNIAAQHLHLNRSVEFAPRDQRRVVLAGEGPDYIHATYIDGYKRRKAFIIAESPMPDTCSNFWRMVYQQKCGAIVMLCEANKAICHQYWLSDTYGDYTTDTGCECCDDNVTTRTITLTNTKIGTSLIVTQFQVLNWTPDGQCSNHVTVARLLNEVLSVQLRTGNKPIIVHCSDTVGRSGIFCATATAIEQCKTERAVDVYQVVKVLRIQKPGSIVTVEQYQLIFDLVLAYLDSMNTYMNSFSNF